MWVTLLNFSTSVHVLKSAPFFKCKFMWKSFFTPMERGLECVFVETFGGFVPLIASRSGVQHPFLGNHGPLKWYLPFVEASPCGWPIWFYVLSLKDPIWMSCTSKSLGRIFYVSLVEVQPWDLVNGALWWFREDPIVPMTPSLDDDGAGGHPLVCPAYARGLYTLGVRFGCRRRLAMTMGSCYYQFGKGLTLWDVSTPTVCADVERPLQPRKSI